MARKLKLGAAQGRIASKHPALKPAAKSSKAKPSGGRFGRRGGGR